MENTLFKTEYVPGVCNIGKEEINRRRNLGWIFLIVTLTVEYAFILLSADAIWKILIFIPATISAMGFLQAYFHFCSGFASRGVFNFGQVGKTETVIDKQLRKLDQKKGMQIMAYSVLIGVVVAVISMAIRI